MLTKCRNALLGLCIGLSAVMLLHAALAAPLVSPPATAAVQPATPPGQPASAPAPAPAATQPAAARGPERWEQAIKQFESWDSRNAFPPEAVLFAGSSSIRLWPTRESFPDLPVLNRGFGGCHIADVTAFAARIVLPYAPQVIVFYAGDNDVADDKTPTRVAADFQEFARSVHASRPDTRIIFMSIKPSLARWAKWPSMQEANRLIAEFCRGDARLAYADVATPMLGADGRPRPELFAEDGLHLGPAGYALWTELMGPRIAAARQDAPEKQP